MFLIFFIFLFHSSLSISQPLHLAIKTGSSITTFSGQSSGATTWDSTKVGFGEPVFSTAMSGYIESLTDPSFQGQILILTYPLIGNYGVPRLMSNSTSLCAPYLAPESHESHRIQIAGLIVSSLIDGTDIDSVQTLRQWLISEGIPVITGVNTRKLVQFLTKQKSTSTSVITTNIHATEIQAIPHQLLLQPRCSAFSCISKSSNSKSKSKSTWSRTRILVLDFGVKHSIIRSLLKYNVDVAVVPFDTNLREEMLRNPYHGLVLSNGPGDPTRHHKSIAHIRDVLVTASKNDQFFHLPVLGICLGFQLLSLALNENKNETLPIATIRKLSFGHRGFNHPVMVHSSNTANTKTNNSKIGYLTSQNHGYSVQFSNQINNQKNYFKQWFVNLHDGTSAGMYFKNRPLMAVQFHPEGGGGPHDTIFIFKTFISLAKKYSTSPRSTRKTETHKDKNPLPELTSSLASSSEPWPPFRLENNFTAPSYSKHQTILILGSGGIMIGQAGEFDYAGSQALKTLRARGIQTILVNPNVASSQTSKGLADIVYFIPLEPDSVEQVLLKHPEITGILLSFGGQTALNVGLVLDANNILQQHNVDILGTSITGIEITEDRNLFKEMLNTINEKAAPSIVVTTLTHGLVSANKIGYPVLIRRAFALGGLGSSFANNATEFEQLFILATTTNDPNGKPAQIIIDKSLLGWKEIEFDVMRDRYGNVIVICTIENLDPVGVHTGESIVIAPSQTLNDHAYQTLRTASIKIANAIGLIGECNIQFAINPLSPANTVSFEYTVIEVNPRLSRSSALASKATGYPIASIATELSLGYSLTELYNPMTGNTTAFFEPVLDYVVVKIPRWDFAMFGNEVDTTISTSMKSIGEAMGIGRTFSEALQKALRMVSSNKQNGFESNNVCLTNSRDFKTSKDLKDLLMKNLSQPGEKRMSYIASAFDHHGMSALEISSATNGINIFFLDLMKETLRLGQELCKYNQVNELSDAFLRTIKKNGYSDYQISNRICSNNYNSKIECNTNVIRQWRTKRGIIPLVQKIDTSAGEFEAKSNYLYMTYADLNLNSNSKEEIAVSSTTNKIIVLGSGKNIFFFFFLLFSFFFFFFH
jgi:carbamoyl-phosphate synthase large subunit